MDRSWTIYSLDHFSENPSPTVGLSQVTSFDLRSSMETMVHQGMPINVLYTHVSSYIGGGNKVLLSLFENMNRHEYVPISIIPSRGPLENELVTRDVNYQIIDLRPTAMRNVSGLLGLLKLGQVTRRNTINVIHANEATTYRASSLVMQFFPTIKRVCHLHHPDITSSLLSWAFQIPPDMVITPSNYVGELVRSFISKGSRTRIRTVWNPIDTEWFTPPDNMSSLRQKIGLSPEKRHLTILGALAKHKGHECFIRMAKTVSDTIKECEFHVVGSEKSGDAEHAAFLRMLAKELGIDDKVRFWGFVEDGTARNLIQSSDLFVLPTREEGFGLVLGEAQACGVPVLSSAIRPIDEVVSDGMTGFLLDPKEPKEFARCAIRLLKNEKERLKMAVCARAWTVSRFSSISFARELQNIYGSLLPGTLSHSL
jgi:glycosyltransferase involved in cell wall biosynthesis